MAKLYCEKIVSRDVPACRFVRKACQRYLAMLAKAESGKATYYFSTDWALDVCDFAEKIPHLEGQWDSETIILEPCQCFWLCAIFGFRRKSNDARLTRHVYLEIPRKSGKSLLMAIVVLYCFLCEGEKGSQVYIGAPKEAQAQKVYGPIKGIVDKLEDLKEHFDLDTTLKRIKKLGDKLAFITTTSSSGATEDGHNPHVVAMEELHAQEYSLYEVQTSSLGARKNPLFISIGTAGRRATGVGWDERKRAIDVSTGVVKNDSYFGLIYTVDEADLEDEARLCTETVIRKANPMYGVSIQPDIIEEFVTKSRGSPNLWIEFKRTRLNIWSNAAGNLIQPQHWNACADKSLKIEDFYGCPAWIGVDLATRRDLCAATIMFEVDGKLITFERYFICEEGAGFSKESVSSLYNGWDDAGDLIKTPGGATDFAYVETEVRAWCTNFDVQAVVFDAYQSNAMLSSLYNDGIPAVQMAPGTKNISDPTDDFVTRIEARTYRHAGHPVTEWMASNVVGYRDSHGNILPKKEHKDSENKIDGIAAIIMANAARIDPEFQVEMPVPNVYEERGLIGASDE